MKKITLLLVLLFLSACQKDKHNYSFYYWRTTLKLDEIEKEVLKNTTNKLYVRYFDVDKKEGEFKIIAPVKKANNFKTTKTIVPVVFITNDTFLFIKEKEIKLLAKKVVATVQKKTIDFDFKETSEIQIDCDWTNKTKEDYFNFLKKLQQISKKEISVTLRLHQVKFKQKTGVPPVKTVFLMCYSTSSPLDKSDKNSILELSVLKDYLESIDEYPIKNIKVALPIYSWGIVENHLGKHKLINGLNRKSLENSNFEKISENEIKILKDDFYFGFFLNKGFKIKVEEISEEKLTKVVAFLNKKIGEYDIIYYHLDSQFIKGRKLQL